MIPETKREFKPTNKSILLKSGERIKSWKEGEEEKNN